MGKGDSRDEDDDVNDDDDAAAAADDDAAVITCASPSDPSPDPDPTPSPSSLCANRFEGMRCCEVPVSTPKIINESSSSSLSWLLPLLWLLLLWLLGVGL